MARHGRLECPSPYESQCETLAGGAALYWEVWGEEGETWRGRRSSREALHRDFLHDSLENMFLGSLA